MLQNPAMFAGYADTPLECVRDWLRVSVETGTSFTTLHHHLTYMCERSFSRAERRYFNALSSTAAVVDYLEQHYGS